MSEISRFLMVSNGNVTGIVDRLVADGFVARAQRNGDRRTSFVSLTRKGRATFAEMASAHEIWIDELLGSISAREAEQLWPSSDRFAANGRVEREHTGVA